MDVERNNLFGGDEIELIYQPFLMTLLQNQKTIQTHYKNARTRAYKIDMDLHESGAIAFYKRWITENYA